jgi:predicted  nucleic acid-binding Zn-ribbon protein
MNIERAIEFLIKNQARMDTRMDAKFDRADQRFVHAEKRLDRLERVVAQNNRIVTQLARSGLSLRSDVRRTQKNLAEASEKIRKITKGLSETDEKLNILIDVVERHIRGNGRER